MQTAGATPTARRYFSAAHYDGKVFIFGGESSCSSMWPRIGVQALDLATKNWSAVQCSGPEPARHFSFGQYNCQMSSAVWKHVMLVRRVPLTWQWLSEHWRPLRCICS